MDIEQSCSGKPWEYTERGKPSSKMRPELPLALKLIVLEKDSAANVGVRKSSVYLRP